MSREDNPVRKARKSLSLTMLEAASRSNLSTTVLQNMETGISKDLNPKLLAFFSARGIDTTKLQQEYQEYRKALQVV